MVIRIDTVTNSDTLVISTKNVIILFINYYIKHVNKMETGGRVSQYDKCQKSFVLLMFLNWFVI